MAGIFAESAKEMGIESHCFSPRRGIINEDSFDFVHHIDIFEMGQILDICKSIQIDGVVATTELTIMVAAFIADQLDLIGIPFDKAKVITDKYRNRLVTAEVVGINHPLYTEVSSVQDIIGLGWEFPVILKPKSKGGKRGVVVIQSVDEINSAFEYTWEGADRCLPLIVEEYINGDIECSVESLSYHGKNYIIQITEKITSGPPHCVELAHHQPANLSEKEKQEIERVVDRGLTAVGLENGPCHTEIKLKEGKIYLIEFNARPGGDHIAYPLIELSTGFSYIKGAINIALDQFESVSKHDMLNRCAGVCFVTQQSRELKSVFDNCQDYEWLVEKREVSENLKTIDHNDGFNTNYYIYCSDSRPDFDSIIQSLE